MTKKVYFKKKAALLIKLGWYAKENNLTTVENRKRANKVTWDKQRPNFDVYGSYQEAYDALSKSLHFIG